MISTLTVGENASVIDFVTKLKDAPFDVLLVMMTPEVTSKNPMFRFLTFLVHTNLQKPEWANRHVEEVWSEKVVHSLQDNAFVVLHSAKVSSGHLLDEVSAVAEDRYPLNSAPWVW